MGSSDDRPRHRREDPSRRGSHGFDRNDPGSSREPERGFRSVWRGSDQPPEPVVGRARVDEGPRTRTVRTPPPSDGGLPRNLALQRNYRHVGSVIARQVRTRLRGKWLAATVAVLIMILGVAVLGG